MMCPYCRYDGGPFAIIHGESTDVGVKGFFSGAMTLLGGGEATKSTRVYFCSVCGISFIKTQHN